MHNCNHPFKLHANRVWRTYRGGKLIDELQGVVEPEDSQFPEEWVASIVSARNPGREDIEDEGLSKLVPQNGKSLTLKHLLESDPVGFLGKEHANIYGANTGVLVKLLDSSERLTIQVHPDINTAAKLFDSRFGKTEAWFVLAGREINGEPPYILLGFKPGVTREKWEQLFWNQDTEAMIECLHKFYIKTGQVYLIQGGTPHAIGPGCFLLEIQEPTDYTIRIERKTPAGLDIPDVLCHQGVGFKKMFECFIYETLSREEVLKRWLLKPDICRLTDGGYQSALISSKDTACFSVDLIEVTCSFALVDKSLFSIIIVISGGGYISWGNEKIDISPGEEIFVPASAVGLIFHRLSIDPLVFVRCFGPGAHTTGKYSSKHQAT